MKRAHKVRKENIDPIKTEIEKMKVTWGADIGTMVKDLSKIVLQDGTITSDERNMMNSINHDIAKFVRLLAQALRDNIISKAEVDQVAKAWKQIQENAETTALVDQKITLDERRMLVRIAETIAKRFN